MPKEIETQTNIEKEVQEKEASPKQEIMATTYDEPSLEKVTVPEKNIPTVRQRIDASVDKYYQDKDELKKQLFQLIQRILYPDQFCPNCDERLFFNTDTITYKCPNCDYSATAPIQSAVSTSGVVTKVPARPQGAVPQQVETAIAEAEKTMRETGVSTKPTALGDKIRKLVAERDSGGMSGPTKEDEARVKGSSRNVANEINWI
jgi:DNA-directed RNA polymerase subunit M/transcription elongation factor TFIIS